MNTPESAPPANNEDRTLVILAHVLPIFFWFLPPLIIWLIKKDQSEYVNDQAKEALNFQITMFIVYVAAGTVSFLIHFYSLSSLVYILNVVFCILAAVEVSKGGRYRYPFCIRLIP